LAAVYFGRLATEEGVGDRVEFRAGDTRSLDVPADTFDAVIAHTLVSHVDDPLAVIKEPRSRMRITPSGHAMPHCGCRSR
jgi:ubiquinone/menaquinone biosynthesis C-methylase UbiE